MGIAKGETMKAKANKAVSRALSTLLIVPLVLATVFAPAYVSAQRNNQTDPPVSDDRTREDGTRNDGTRDDGTRNDGTRDDGTRNDGTRNDGTRNDGTRDDGTRNDGTRTGGTRPADGRGGVDKIKASDLLARVTKTQSLFEQFLAKVAELRKELETRATTAGVKLDFTAVDAKKASVETTYAELEGKITVFVLQVNNTSEMPSSDPIAQFKQISTGFRTLFIQVFSLAQDMKALWQKLPADSRPVQSETRPGGKRDGRVNPTGSTRPGTGTRPGSGTRPTMPPETVRPTRQIMPPVQQGSGR